MHPCHPSSRHPPHRSPARSSSRPVSPPIPRALAAPSLRLTLPPATRPSPPPPFPTTTRAAISSHLACRTRRLGLTPYSLSVLKSLLGLNLLYPRKSYIVNRKSLLSLIYGCFGFPTRPA